MGFFAKKPPADPAVAATVKGLFLYNVPTYLFLLGGIVFFIYAAPMRMWETGPLLALGIFPFTFLLTLQIWRSVVAFGLRHAPPLEPDENERVIQPGGLSAWLALDRYHQIGNDRVRRIIATTIFLFLCSLTGFLAGSILFLNRYLDKQPSQNFIMPLESKHISYRKNHKSYQLVVASPSPPLLPFIDYDSHEVITTDARSYERALIGETKVAIEVHRGAFGIPWYRSTNYGVEGLKTGNTKIENDMRERPEVLAEACEWRDRYAVRNEIEDGDGMMKQEYWGNGTLKSEEATLNGVLHGTSRYWHDNGKLYALIPYYYGKKHGSFTLFRPDGVIAQRLSYREDKPFGINEWYDERGHLTKSLLYMRDGSTQETFVCSHLGGGQQK